jgi:hypothetical protein
MDVLSRRASAVLCGCLLLASSAWAGSEDSVVINEKGLLIEEQDHALCSSTKEYIETLKFLRTDHHLLLTENAARKVAEKVARGCDGAARRFAKVLLLLNGVGLTDRGALQLALQFSAQPPDVQKNFSEIFSHAFLREFFDYDYPHAVQLAYELSRDYHGDPAQAREDFLEILHFCKGNKSLDLPNSLCAELTVRFAHLSQFFPYGVREPFHQLFDKLRADREFSMSIKTALDVTYNVLKSGPRAPDNFLSAFRFASDKDGLGMSQHDAVLFAVRMADRSFVGEDHPPAIPAHISEEPHVAKP